MRSANVIWHKSYYFVGLALFSSLIAIDCRDVPQAECTDEPLGRVTVWVEESDAFKPLRFSGTVEAIFPGNEQLDRVSIVDEDGKQWSLRFRATSVPFPVKVKHHYQFEIQHVGGWPATSSIFIWDEQGLLFVGVSDWEVGGNVAKSGVPGFQFEKVSTDCESRPHGSCYDELKNAILKVSAGEESAMLFHGKSVRFGSYQVTCLTCQDVVYNSSCADAGLLSVSYAIVRLPSELKQ